MDSVQEGYEKVRESYSWDTIAERFLLAITQAMEENSLSKGA